MTNRNDDNLLQAPLMPSGRSREIPLFNGAKPVEPEIRLSQAPRNLAKRVGTLLGYSLYALFALGGVLVVGVIAAIVISSFG